MEDDVSIYTSLVFKKNFLNIYYKYYLSYNRILFVLRSIISRTDGLLFSALIYFRLKSNSFCCCCCCCCWK